MASQNWMRLFNKRSLCPHSGRAAQNWSEGWHQVTWYRRIMLGCRKSFIIWISRTIFFKFSSSIRDLSIIFMATYNMRFKIADGCEVHHTWCQILVSDSHVNFSRWIWGSSSFSIGHRQQLFSLSGITLKYASILTTTSAERPKSKNWTKNRYIEKRAICPTTSVWDN